MTTTWPQSRRQCLQVVVNAVSPLNLWLFVSMTAAMAILPSIDTSWLWALQWLEFAAIIGLIGAVLLWAWGPQGDKPFQAACWIVLSNSLALFLGSWLGETLFKHTITTL